MSGPTRNQRSHLHHAYNPATLPEYSLGYNSSYQDSTQQACSIAPPQYQYAATDPNIYETNSHQYGQQIHSFHATGTQILPNLPQTLPTPQPPSSPARGLHITHPGIVSSQAIRSAQPSMAGHRLASYTQDDRELVPLVKQLLTSLLRVVDARAAGPHGPHPNKTPVFEGWEFRSAHGDCVTGTWTRFIGKQAILSIRSKCLACGRGGIPHDDTKCQSGIVLEGPVVYGANNDVLKSPYLWTISHQLGTPYRNRVDGILDEVLGHLNVADKAFDTSAGAEAIESYRFLHDATGVRHSIGVFRASLRPGHEGDLVKWMENDGRNIVDVDRFVGQNFHFNHAVARSPILKIGSRYDSGIMVQLFYNRASTPTMENIDVRYEVAALVLAILYNRHARLQTFHFSRLCFSCL